MTPDTDRSQSPLRGRLHRHSVGGVAYWTDDSLADAGVLVAFSERGGGVSRAPYESLNLAFHVGDDPAAVDENRRRLLAATGTDAFSRALTSADQVHGDRIVHVDEELAGSGALSSARLGPVPSADGLVTSLPGVPLLMCYADCVPVVLVAPGPVVAVLHAGWRGVLAKLPGKGVREVAATAGCDTGDVLAFIGPHICGTCYQVGADVMSQFASAFDTVPQAESVGLDLGAAVRETLADTGVPLCSIASLGACTAEETDEYFSYRAEGGLTGRHGALVCIRPPSS